MRRTLSKSRLAAFRQCPKRLWLQAFRRDLAVIDPGAQARFDAGHRVGEIARALRPGGTLVGHVDDPGRALQDTRELLADSGDRLLFEPALKAGGVLVRADVLERRDGRCRLVEVKSSTSVKPPHLEDVAIQSWVIRGSGLALETVTLAHVDSTFVFPGNGDYEGLFVEADVTDDVRPILEQVPRWVNEAQRMLGGGMPVRDIGAHCTQPYDCEFFAWCSRHEPEYPVSILPRGGALAADLRAEGLRDLREVPEARLDSATQVRVWRATRAGKAEVDPAAGDMLRGLGYPRAYLDFETIAPAVPLWAGTRPYQRIPIQWSCHVQSEPGRLVALGELAVTGLDPRRAFAESLVRAMPPDGPVFVYNAAFERGVLNELAQALPDLAAPLQEIADRLVDLLPITRDHYYDPAMKGSWSLKAVLPTIAPDLDYANLEGGVHSGGDVESVYARILDTATEAGARSDLEAALRAYCERDTLALARLVAFFEALPSA
ncbi:MAG: DUF2779 domain-containing protein [Burkholderiales bacterium]|nr:DUF2779 domain-containing protein [Burkholderiales bacterium]